MKYCALLLLYVTPFSFAMGQVANFIPMGSLGSANTLVCVRGDSAGGIWVVSTGGAASIEYQVGHLVDGAFEVVSVAGRGYPFGARVAVNDLACSPDGTAYLATAHGALAYVDGRWVPLPAVDTVFTYRVCDGVAVSPEGAVWFSALAAVVDYIDSTGGRYFTHYTLAFPEITLWSGGRWDVKARSPGVVSEFSRPTIGSDGRAYFGRGGDRRMYVWSCDTSGCTVLDVADGSPLARQPRLSEVLGGSGPVWWISTNAYWGSDSRAVPGAVYTVDQDDTTARLRRQYRGFSSVRRMFPATEGVSTLVIGGPPLGEQGYFINGVVDTVGVNVAANFPDWQTYPGFATIADVEPFRGQALVATGKGLLVLPTMPSSIEVPYTRALSAALSFAPLPARRSQSLLAFDPRLGSMSIRSVSVIDAVGLSTPCDWVLDGHHLRVSPGPATAGVYLAVVRLVDGSQILGRLLIID